MNAFNGSPHFIALCVGDDVRLHCCDRWALLCRCIQGQTTNYSLCQRERRNIYQFQFQSPVSVRLSIARELYWMDPRKNLIFIYPLVRVFVFSSLYFVRSSVRSRGECATAYSEFTDIVRKLLLQFALLFYWIEWHQREDSRQEMNMPHKLQKTSQPQLKRIELKETKKKKAKIFQRKKKRK